MMSDQARRKRTHMNSIRARAGGVSGCAPKFLVHVFQGRRRDDLGDLVNVRYVCSETKAIGTNAKCTLLRPQFR